MLRIVLLCAGLGLLVGCGVDGEPWTPTMGATIGVGTGGVHTGGHVGVSNGPISIMVGGGGCSRYGC